MSKIDIEIGSETFESDYSIATITRLERSTGHCIQSLFDMARDQKISVDLMLKILPISLGVRDAAKIVEKHGVFGVGFGLAQYFSWCLYLPEMGKAVEKMAESEDQSEKKT